MDNLSSYIKNEKINNENSIVEISKKIGKCLYDIETIDKKIIECTKNIDTTYEIFSPNAFDKDYNVVEIEKLNLKKISLQEEINNLNESKKMFIGRQKKIDLAYDELEELNHQIIEEKHTYKEDLKKQKDKLNHYYFEEITDILECQINKDNNFIGSEIIRQLDIIENKLSLCENFVDMDINRAKLQLMKIGEEISYFKKKLISKMFHVKHFEDNLYFDLNNEIKSFVNQYKKNINARVEYKFHGKNISDNKNNIINIFRIIKEAVDNADNHSQCNVISIYVDVDEYDSVSDNNTDITNIFFQNESDVGNNISDKTYPRNFLNSRDDNFTDRSTMEENDCKIKHEENDMVKINIINSTDEQTNDIINRNSRNVLSNHLLNNPDDNTNIHHNDVISFSDIIGNDNNMKKDMIDNEHSDNESINHNLQNNNVNRSYDIDSKKNNLLNSNNYLSDSSSSLKNNKDMHQINFIIDEDKKSYTVTIKISDNGTGFNVQETNLLIKNNLYGIYFMKYRADKLRAKFNISSEKGLGTTVTVMYTI